MDNAKKAISEWFKKNQIALDDFDDVKDKLYVVLRNKERNMDMFERGICREIGDMIAVCGIYVSKTLNDSNMIMVKKSILELWGVDEDTVFELALKNTQRMFPAEPRRMKDLFPNDANELGEPFENAVIITNCKKDFGVSAVLYEGMLKKTSEVLGAKNYYIIMSEHQEAFAFAVDPDSECLADGTEAFYDNILRVIFQVNKFKTNETNLLSETLYHYDSETDTLKEVRSIEKVKEMPIYKKIMSMEREEALDEV